MTNTDNQINVIEYVQQIKTELINEIRLMEVNISRKFDEILYIAEAMTNEIKELSKVDNSKGENNNVDN